METVALASCLVQPFADVVLSGAVTEEQVLSNVRSCLLNLDRDAMPRLMALAEPAHSYWTTRKKTTSILDGRRFFGCDMNTFANDAQKRQNLNFYKLLTPREIFQVFMGRTISYPG